MSFRRPTLPGPLTLASLGPRRCRVPGALWPANLLLGAPFSLVSCTFNGSDEYVTMGNVLGFEYTSPFSISFWLKTIDTNDFTVCKSTIGANEYRGYAVGLNAGYVDWRLRSNNATNNQIHALGTTLVNDDDWHHVVVTWDGNASPGAAGLHIYVDGGPDEASFDIDNLSATIVSTAPLNIAVRNLVDGFFAGLLDDVSIYDKELSYAEAQAIYNLGEPVDNEGLPDSSANLVGYWLMGDGATSPTIPDETVAGNDGTMVNMDATNFSSDVPP